jgi:hypothetical protein
LDWFRVGYQVEANKNPKPGFGFGVNKKKEPRFNSDLGFVLKDENLV